jgi:hypothetical protein
MAHMLAPTMPNRMISKQVPLPRYCQLFPFGFTELCMRYKGAPKNAALSLASRCPLPRGPLQLALCQPL